MILVRLTQPNMVISAVVALKRCANQKQHSVAHFNRVSFFENIVYNSEAVAAEFAVAQLFGFKDFEPTVDTFKKAADVGRNIEVKHTRWKDGHLIIHPGDRDNDVAVLVTGDAPNLYVCGWIPVKDAKQRKFSRGKANDISYWVGQQDLFPILDLKESIYGDATI